MGAIFLSRHLNLSCSHKRLSPWTHLKVPSRHFLIILKVHYLIEKNMVSYLSICKHCFCPWIFCSLKFLFCPIPDPRSDSRQLLGELGIAFSIWGLLRGEFGPDWQRVGVTRLLIHSDSFPTHSRTRNAICWIVGSGPRAEKHSEKIRIFGKKFKRTFKI